ncbi:hypothetical protein LIER_25864 [Lithospermum erythrorhizon]|uniref:Uncharacterized protein n=1 Tax=Lithospermum erythrorhizon TaxID=34254 RepID=A0AAV3R8G0_LITER
MNGNCFVRNQDIWLDPMHLAVVALIDEWKSSEGDNSSSFIPTLICPEGRDETKKKNAKAIIFSIVNSLSSFDAYFTQRQNHAGKRDLLSLQKCIAAIRMLAYGVAVDACDEYVKIEKTTALECVCKFCEGIIAIFEKD